MLCPLFLKMVQKNAGMSVVRLYGDDSLPYLGIRFVGGEKVGVGSNRICTLSASDN